MAAKSEARLERLLYPFIRYLHDCLAAQVEWGRAINVLGQRDVFLLPLTRRQQARLGKKGSLSLRGPRATELGNRFATGGSEVSLSLGALFLVGRAPATGKRPERRYCAPLLEVPLGLRRDLPSGRILVEPEEVEFSVNYGLLSEILGPDEEDLQDRLVDLAELVPDFPIDEREFRDFWNGFRMIASGLPLAAQKPRPRRGRQPAAETDDGNPPGEAGTQSPSLPDDPARDAAQGSRVNVDDPEPLSMVDFYVPVIPTDALFRLLPATTIILGRRTGPVSRSTASRAGSSGGGDGGRRGGPCDFSTCRATGTVLWKSWTRRFGSTSFVWRWSGSSGHWARPFPPICFGRSSHTWSRGGPRRRCDCCG